MDEEFSEYFDVVKDEDSNLIENFDKEVTSEKDSKENVETPQYFCDNCNRKFVNKNSFIRHNLKHAGDKHQCSVCEFKSGLVTGIEKHQRVEHPDVSLNCEDCKYFTFSNDNLRMHLKYEHKNIRKYKCEDCSFVSGYKCALDVHKRGMHDNVRHKCEMCDYETTYKGNLQKHIITHQADKGVKAVKKVKCTECDLMFYNQSSMKAHFR